MNLVDKSNREKKMARRKAEPKTKIVEINGIPVRVKCYEEMGTRKPTWGHGKLRGKQTRDSDLVLGMSDNDILAHELQKKEREEKERCKILLGLGQR